VRHSLLSCVLPYNSVARIDVLQLIEEAVEGTWIGHRARMFTRQQESEIGSLYAPPRQDGSGKKLVEVVIEIGDRKEVGAVLIHCQPSMGAYDQTQGWLLKLEKGGIRRVLMNIFGNSLKFTTVCFFPCDECLSLHLYRRMVTCT